MAGRLSLLTPKTGALVAVEGVPGMHLAADLEEEGGLFDVINHPDYARNGWIYLAYSAAAPEGNTTVVDRARLEGPG
jgi:aldose sugar dehydrogenase